MRSLVAYLPLIACGAMMLVMCVPMLMGRKHNNMSDQAASQEEVAELRDEISRLKAEAALGDKPGALNV